MGRKYPLAMIDVCVAGITGWVGQPLARAISEQDDLRLAAGIARGGAGTKVDGAPISATVEDALTIPFDVLVDYTAADAAKRHALVAAEAGRHVVIGSSGLTTGDFEEIDRVARAAGVGVLAVGNFAITAALLERFAVEAGFGRRRSASRWTRRSATRPLGVRRSTALGSTRCGCPATPSASRSGSASRTSG
jgi:dihydrodipicolinate reductase